LAQHSYQPKFWENIFPPSLGSIPLLSRTIALACIGPVEEALQAPSTLGGALQILGLTAF